MKKLALAVFFTLASTISVMAQGVTHYVAIHVDQNDPKVMNLALNNAQNITKYYESKGDTVVIEMVTYGPGLNMLIEGKSPVADRIAVMSLEMENLSFAACANTMSKMEAKTGKKIPIIQEATIVPSGVVTLIELQEKGYAYVKP
ncbi:MAG: hypothetical protein COC12_04040 [Rhodobacteraceae bacterium]|nr:MAG: hypothetical protein COC12_04040 [Paracoccaceae bacterium]